MNDKGVCTCLEKKNEREREKGSAFFFYILSHRSLSLFVLDEANLGSTVIDILY